MKVLNHLKYCTIELHVQPPQANKSKWFSRFKNTVQNPALISFHTHRRHHISRRVQFTYHMQAQKSTFQSQRETDFFTEIPSSITKFKKTIVTKLRDAFYATFIERGLKTSITRDLWRYRAVFNDTWHQHRHMYDTNVHQNDNITCILTAWISTGDALWIYRKLETRIYATMECE